MADDIIQGKSSGHGGRRVGAGRKPGSATKKTREIAEAALESGQSPLEYLLSIMRDPRADEDKRIDCAKAAAPYIHPRLSSVEANVKASVSVGDMLDELDG